AYLRHRLLQAGAYKDTVCTAAAIQKIARYARGNPRVMNMLCTNLLIMGFLAKQKPIPAAMARDVIAAYRAKTPPTLWQRGVAYTAGVLVVAGRVGAFHYAYGAVSAPASANLAHFTTLPREL